MTFRFRRPFIVRGQRTVLGSIIYDHPVNAS